MFTFLQLLTAKVKEHQFLFFVIIIGLILFVWFSFRHFFNNVGEEEQLSKYGSTFFRTWFSINILAAVFAILFGGAFIASLF